MLLQYIGNKANDLIAGLVVFGIQALKFCNKENHGIANDKRGGRPTMTKVMWSLIINPKDSLIKILSHPIRKG